MNCADVDAIMTAYVDGEAAPADAAAVRAHLDGCPACRARAAEEREMRARLQAAVGLLGGVSRKKERALEKEWSSRGGS